MVFYRNQKLLQKTAQVDKSKVDICNTYNGVVYSRTSTEAEFVFHDVYAISHAQYYTELM